MLEKNRKKREEKMIKNDAVSQYALKLLEQCNTMIEKIKTDKNEIIPPEKTLTPPASPKNPIPLKPKRIFV